MKANQQKANQTPTISKKTYRHWTNDDLIELRRLLELGTHDIEIAKKMGRTRQSIYNKRNMCGWIDSNRGNWRKGTTWR